MDPQQQDRLLQGVYNPESERQTAEVKTVDIDAGNHGISTLQTDIDVGMRA